MFKELENSLKNILSKIKNLSIEIQGLKQKIDQINGQILATTQNVDGDMEFYSRNEVAKKLGVHIDTITNYINNGELGSIRIGRRILIEKKSLISFIDKNRQI
jgi:excisionase family DNA binding protein